MPKRQSEAARILRFFDSAPADSAALIFDLVRDRMKARGIGAKAKPQVSRAKPRNKGAVDGGANAADTSQPHA